ncbi:UTP--glucose-1-phosphate uridylyltransferase [Planctomycetota bacterium]
MTSCKRFENLQKLLEKHNQSHLLAFYGQLPAEKQEKLLSQVEELDFGKIDEWVSSLVKNASGTTIPADFSPVDAYTSLPAGPKEQAKYSETAELGRKLIADGKVAAFVVAGGQGTRLGFDGPKGNFPISQVKNKTLFQIFAETIDAASAKYGPAIPWYIMTSPLNHKQTVEIFRSNDYYGLKDSNVFIFQQGTLPNFDFEVKILLADKDRIACSPDGHGGSLKALYKSGALEDMEKRGIEFISYFQVDNSLVNILDPLFIGLHALDDAEMSSKALRKDSPYDQVGNFCLVDGKVTVIEYSDLPDEYAQKRKPDGSLVFSLGSIAIHIINRSFVERLNEGGFSLPLHRAVKKIHHIDEQGNFVKPGEPNGVKLESFVFDALPLARKSIILQTVKEQEFAPVKNASGINNPDDIRKRMVARCADWLESAGITVPRKPDGSVDAVLELAPSFALEKSDIESKAEKIPQIKPGDELYLE